MYGRILVPLDGSPLALEALATAWRVAELHSAHLWLVTVTGPTGTPVRPANVFAAAERVLERLGPARVVVAERTALDGEPGAVLAELDRAHPEALVCMTSRGAHPLRRALLGSVTHEVVRRSDQAVLVVGPQVARHHDTPLRRLLVCLDGSEAAEVVLPWTLPWRTAGAELELVRVHYPVAAPAAKVPPDQTTTRAAAYLREVASRLVSDGHHVTTRSIVHTDPPAALVELAHGHRDDVLALATAGAGPAKEFVLGSTFAALLRKGPLPLLVVARSAEP